MDEVWSTVHNTECWLTADLRPRNKDECHTRMSQSCERLVMTNGSHFQLHFPPRLFCSSFIFVLHFQSTSTVWPYAICGYAMPGSSRSHRRCSRLQRKMQIHIDNIQIDRKMKMHEPSSCIHHLLPPARDPDLTSRLRRESIYPRPRKRTNCYKSFIHHALLKFQQFSTTPYFVPTLFLAVSFRCSVVVSLLDGIF